MGAVNYSPKKNSNDGYQYEHGSAAAGSRICRKKRRTGRESDLIFYRIGDEIHFDNARTTDLAKQALAITEAGLKAQFEHARKLMQAKSVNEVMQLQSQFVQNQFGAATDQFKKMTSDMWSAGRDAANKTTI